MLVLKWSPESVGMGLTGGTDITPTPFLCPDSNSKGEEGTGGDVGSVLLDIVVFIKLWA